MNGFDADLTKSIQSALRDLELAHVWVLYPGKQTYALASDVTVLPLSEIPVL